MDVLVIDDDAVLRLAVSETLKSAGFRVTTCGDGETALQQITQGTVQLVVCDWSMPGMSGLEVCRAVRSGDLRRYVYILLLTAHNRTEDLLQGLEAGADDYITKPFNPAELVQRVNTGRRIVRSESSSITVFALAKLVESRDNETGAHLERVQRYCRILAEQLRRNAGFAAVITDEFVQLIWETSPLHDIGKVAIPDAILLKPDRLTREEFEVVKTHTVHGAATLAAAMEKFPNATFLQMAHDIALCHHERHDGLGYPSGLAGEQIPVAARIVALADVYDALRSRRVYKQAMEHEAAKALIMAESGRQFHPDVTDAFLSAEHQFQDVCEQFADRTYLECSC